MPANYGILYESIFGVSPEKIVTVIGNLTVKVKNRVSGKPIKGAEVIVNGNQATADDLGLAIFETLEPGTYKIIIKAPGYLTSVKTITFEQGTLKEFSLWPWWAIGAAGVGGVVAFVVIMEAVTKPKR